MEIEEGEVTSEDVIAKELGEAPEPTEPEPEAPTSTEPAEPSEPPEPVATEPAEPAPAETVIDDEPTVTETEADKMARLESQVNSLHRRIEKQGKRKFEPTPPEPIDDANAPNLDDFDTIGEYEEAATKFRIDQQVAAQVRKALERQPEDDIKADREEFNRELAVEGPKRYADFDEIVKNPQLPLTFDILDVVRSSDNPDVAPADVLYFLGKNPAEAVRISRMNPIQLAREVVKIENRLAAGLKKPPRTVSAAPEPITPTDSTVIVTKDPNKMTQAEYEAWRAEGGT